MIRPATKPCPAVVDGQPCGGEMTYEPRDPGEPPDFGSPMGGAPGSPPCWCCDTCDRLEIVDDDPGTMPMFA